MFTSSEDGTVRLWESKTKRCLTSYKNEHEYPIWAMDLLPTQLWFATGSHDKTCRLWRTETSQGCSERVFWGHYADVTCIKFHPNGQYLVSGSEDKTVRLWDIRQQTNAKIFGAGSPVNAIAISPDGKYIAAGTDNGVQVWDLNTPKANSTPFLSPKASSLRIWSLDFSHDGGFLTSTSESMLSIFGIREKKNYLSSNKGQPLEKCFHLEEFTDCW